MTDQPAPADGPSPEPFLLLRELVRQPARLSAALLLALASTAASLALPLLVRQVITDFADHRSLVTVVSLLALAAVAGAVTQALSGSLMARIGEDLVYRLRTRLMAHCLRLPLPTVRAHGAGDITSRITSDAVLLRQTVDTAGQLPLSVLTVAATLAVMAWIDWVLTAVTLCALGALTGLVLLIVRRMRAGMNGQQSAIGRVAQRFTADLAALSTIKAYQAEDLAARALAEEADGLRRLSLRNGTLGALLPAALTLGNQLAMIAVILTGGARMAAGELQAGSFAAFLLYLLQAVPSVNTLATAFGRLQAGLAARDRCNDLLRLPPEADADPRRAVPTPTPGSASVVFSDVRFTHAGADHPALRDLSFSAPRTGLTAVVGPSGAGKSTTLSLIEAFVRPRSGTISLLGHDLRHWPLQALRSRIAYVDQEFTLLQASVRDNLQLGRSSAASEAQLMDALDAVGLCADIARLPAGLDTLLGRGTDLSGGQRQRMALARALLSDADVVLLDEPTSQLDALNELRFRTVVETLARSRAVIVVAHRLSTVRHADHVVLMHQGEVVDAADHPTLLARCGLYRELVAAQTTAETGTNPAATH
ncbi:ABC transporter ATP-binding protein [Streptacidiphilus anmyonensis]|uniref:ABC transporter ATP-binding protein n=1 Tax=Streptacidiphilus anmyonensis TaxID=405782 RepID=UPI0007C81FB0|nr:ABC transporter ATP-binding protein [Streptacidiphilus anmyonensis]